MKKRNFCWHLIHTICFVLLTLFFSQPLNAQKYPFESLSIQDGLPASHITTLFQDSQHNLWIGTNGGGLCKYNSYEFIHYNTSNGLPGNTVNAITEDTLNTLWVLTDVGIAALTGDTFHTYSNPEFTSLYRNENRMIRGLSTAGQFYTFYCDKEKGIAYHKDSTALGLRIAKSAQKATDHLGRIWLSSDNTIHVLDPKKGYQPVELGIHHHIPQDKVTALAYAEPGEIWLGTKNSGLFLVQYSVDSVYLKRSYNNYFDRIDNHITSIFIDTNNDVWAGTYNGGLLYIDFPFLKVLNTGNGLGTRQITCVTNDMEGNIWVGTRNDGIRQFKGWQFVYYDHQSGLPQTTIHDITQAPNGYYWFAAQDGLFRAKRRNDQLQYDNVLLPEEWTNANFSTILFPSPSDYVFSTLNKGVFLVINDTPKSLTTHNGLPSNTVNSLHLINNKLYIGSAKGLSIADLDHADSINNPPLLKNKHILAIENISEDRILIAAREGLYQFTQDTLIRYTESHHLKHHWINTLCTSETGNVFAGTMGGGLYYTRLDSSQQDFITSFHWIQPEKLASPNVYSLLMLNDSTLIAGTDKGLNKIVFSPANFHQPHSITYFQTDNVSIPMECQRNAIFKDNREDIWLGTKAGVVKFNPQSEPITKAKPRLHFGKLKINTEPVAWDPDEEMNLKHNENYIEFSFTGIYFSEKLTYQFLLEGHDKQWSTATTQRFANYSNLSPGQYTFHVKASSLSGMESEKRSYGFVIKPPFWKTWWFFVMLFIFMIAAIILLIRNRERKLKRDKETLEKTVKLRTKEIAEQKTKIEDQKKQLTDSIQYAKRIQDAVISDPKKIEKHIAAHFIVYLPRDIVSGDFYWFGQQDDNLYFAVADCTGHGVPGAFMSMLGIRLLNEIILEKGVQYPDQVLNQIRSAIIQSLNQKQDDDGSKDGMDMALCCYNMKQRKLYFSGAYNSMILIRKGTLKEFKGDRMPVAIYHQTNDFTCNTLDCEPEDQLYLFSDGLPDQFGGPQQKKYKVKQLRELLLSVHTKPMAEQKEIILSEFYKWKGHNEQVDDVSLIGINIA